MVVSFTSCPKMLIIVLCCLKLAVSHPRGISVRGEMNLLVFCSFVKCFGTLWDVKHYIYIIHKSLHYNNVASATLIGSLAHMHWDTVFSHILFFPSDGCLPISLLIPTPSSSFSPFPGQLLIPGFHLPLPSLHATGLVLVPSTLKSGSFLLLAAWIQEWWVRQAPCSQFRCLDLYLAQPTTATTVQLQVKFCLDLGWSMPSAPGLFRKFSC